MMKFPELHWKNWLFAFLFIACLIILYKGLDNYQVVFESAQRLLGLLSPFATGLLLAYLLHIPCRGIEGLLKRIPGRIMPKAARPLSVVLLFLVVFSFIAGVISFIIPPIKQSIIDVANNLPSLVTTGMNFLAQLRIDPDQLNFLDIFSLPLDYIFSNFNLQKVFDVSMNAVSGIFSFFVAVVVAVYMLLNPAPFLNSVKRIARIFLKEENIKTLSSYVTKTNGIFYKFISCQLLDALIVGIISGIGMGILLDIRYAALLAVILAIFNVIPFVGAFVGVAAATVTTLISGGLSQALLVLVFLIVLQQVDGNIIVPRLLGQSLNLNPVIIILAITIGGTYGIGGMFLSVPIVAVLKIILSDIMQFLEDRNLKRRVVEVVKTQE